MDQASVGFIDQIIGLAQKLGGLSSSAILALVVVALGYDSYRNRKDEKEVALKRLETWQDSTKAEIAQTDMMQKQNETLVMLVTNVNMLSNQIKYFSTILEERVPRKGL